MSLCVENLSFRYDRKGEWLLKDVSFSMSKKERLGVMAPSGYGKSTLAKILAGIHVPASGQVYLSEESQEEKKKTRFNPIQLIYQHPEQAVNPRWTIKKILDETKQGHPQILASLGIQEEWLNRYPHELSGGQLQRCCIARALAAETQFLIADEISTMLDTVTQAQLWQYLLSEVEARGIGLLVISHNQQLLKRVCTRQVDLRTMNQVETLS
ncbi:ABC transporter ATP-binding protein [Enterococcus sp. LJL98]